MLIPNHRRNQPFSGISDLLCNFMGISFGDGFRCLKFILLFFILSTHNSFAQTTESESDNSQSQIQSSDTLSSENNSENPDSESIPEESQLKTDTVFNIDVLIERMKGTKAIGVISKLSLKNQVDDLLEQASDIKSTESAQDGAKLKSELREEFEGLILKTVTLLNKGEDFILAEDIYLAREELWKSIMENKA